MGYYDKQEIVGTQLRDIFAITQEENDVLAQVLWEVDLSIRVRVEFQIPAPGN